MILVYNCMAPYVDQLFIAMSQWQPVVGVDVRLSEAGFCLRRRRIVRETPYPVIQLDLPRGYGRKFFWIARPRLRGVRAQAEALAGEPLRTVVFTLPHFAPLAADFEDVLKVYNADADFRFFGWGNAFVERRERYVLSKVNHTFCASKELARRFQQVYGFYRARCHLLPMATRQASLLPAPLHAPAPLPDDVRRLERPIAGVVGSMSQRTDMELVAYAAERLPWLSWLFVGPVQWDNARRKATIKRLRSMKERVLFTGPRPYERLAEYARALDVAVIPYAYDDFNKYASPTRLFDHLAATRPIVATRACPQFNDFAQVLHFADTPEEFVAVLTQLRQVDFNDGLAEERWRLSQENTWDDRARAMLRALGELHNPQSQQSSCVA